MENQFQSNVKKLYVTVQQNISKISIRIYDFLMKNIKIVILFALLLSITFSILKIILFNGYNVDSYQYFALSIKEYILTGKRSYLFDNFYARNRMMYPFLIAIFNIIFPFNVSILACILNLIFAVLSLWLIRLNLRKLNFQEQVINLSTLLIIMSYNLLNYWFNILTDFVSLLFFLTFVLFLQRFIQTRNFFDLGFSIVFFLYTVLSREVYITSIVLFIFIFKSRKTKIIILSTAFVLILTLILAIPERIPFMDHFIASSYWDYYVNRKIFHLLFFLQSKWIMPKYFVSYLKGLVKVGIIPVVFFLLIIKRKNLKSIIKINSKKQGFILICWFIFFFLFYTFFYSNQSSASGLRYWLPISWIPLVYSSNIIVRNKEIKNWKTFIILFLCLFPIAWSGLEWYVNKDTPSGTGSFIDSNVYYNEMTNIKTIVRQDSSFISVGLVNGTYFRSRVQPEALEPDSNVQDRAKYFFNFWLNASEKIIVEIRLKSPNNASWGFSLYEVKENYSPGIGKMKYSIQNQNSSIEFIIYKFEIEAKFLVRFIALSLGNSLDSEILWDYLKIEVF